MRPESLDTVMMTLEMLKRIPRTGKVTAVALREQLAHAGFERDLRTVQRQLSALCEHLDIDCDDRSKPYGYSWKPNARVFAIQRLSEQEVLLLRLAEEQLRQLLPAALMKSMSSFFDQARQQLQPGLERSKARQWLDKVRVVSVTQPLLAPTVKTDVFEAVSNALYADHWIQLNYTNAAGRTTASKVMPLGLAQQGVRLFLVCCFDGFEEPRSLALHRIQSAVDTRQAFVRLAGFDLKAFDDQGQFGFGYGKVINVVFRLPAAIGFHLTETPLSADQTVRQLRDGRLEFRATVIESGQLRWWLRGFGEQLEMVRPKCLLKG